MNNGKMYHWMRDEEYFRWLHGLKHKYGLEQVYNDFLYVYNHVTINATSMVANKVVRRVDAHYPVHTQQWWGMFFMTMLAEEFKENSILGKRIKHLGVYNLLFDKYNVKYITKYMRGLSWYELDSLCVERNI